MTKPEAIEPAVDQRRLRLDIHLNLKGLSDPDGPLAWLSQFAKVAESVTPGDKLIELAGKLYHSRRLRERFLNSALLGEPVWDMLLALYCFAGQGKALSVSGLCHSSAVPPTTALRWVEIMEQRKLIKRSKDHSDARRTLLSMTEDGKKLMDDYLTLLLGSAP